MIDHRYRRIADGQHGHFPAVFGQVLGEFRHPLDPRASHRRKLVGNQQDASGFRCHGVLSRGSKVRGCRQPASQGEIHFAQAAESPRYDNTAEEISVYSSNPCGKVCVLPRKLRQVHVDALPIIAADMGLYLLRYSVGRAAQSKAETRLSSTPGSSARGSRPANSPPTDAIGLPLANGSRRPEPARSAGDGAMGLGPPDVP